MQEELKVNSILKDFHKISGTRISIHDREFNEIYSYPHEILPFCKKIQENTDVLKMCKNNDKTAISTIKNSTIKSNGGIGIVPYTYDAAFNYYLAIWSANERNENKNIEELLPKEETLVKISSPKRKPLKKSNFAFLMEDTEWKKVNI